LLADRFCVHPQCRRAAGKRRFGAGSDALYPGRGVVLCLQCGSMQLAMDLDRLVKVATVFSLVKGL
jgi:hypothetical protein